MRIFDKKSIVLNNGNEEYEVEVVLKEVLVKNGKKAVKAFSKIK